MSLSIEEAVHEGVTTTLEAYYETSLETHSTVVSLEMVIGAAQEALEDFVVNVTNGYKNLQDIVG